MLKHEFGNIIDQHISKSTGVKSLEYLKCVTKKLMTGEIPITVWAWEQNVYISL